MGIKKTLYASFVIGNLVAAIYFLVYTVAHTQDELIDFPVFYGAARNALYGLSLFGIARRINTEYNGTFEKPRTV